jgi:hypothetical protein
MLFRKATVQIEAKPGSGEHQHRRGGGYEKRVHGRRNSKRVAEALLEKAGLVRNRSSTPGILK